MYGIEEAAVLSAALGTRLTSDSDGSVPTSQVVVDGGVVHCVRPVRADRSSIARATRVHAGVSGARGGALTAQAHV